jgi:hypothetical protein
MTHFSRLNPPAPDAPSVAAAAADLGMAVRGGPDATAATRPGAWITDEPDRQPAGNFPGLGRRTPPAAR